MAVRSESSHKRKLASPTEVEHWSLTAPREKLVKIGAKVVRHGRVAPDTAAAQIVEKCIAGMTIAQLSRAAKGDK